MMEKMRKQSVLKEVRTTGMWAGYVAASKVAGFHVDGGWMLGARIIITQGRDEKYYVVYPDKYMTSESFEELETWIHSFKWYNCNSELGHEARFWIH